MSEEKSPPPEGAPPRTPFDNPLFLPVLLWLFAVWFGYDAFLNTDEHMQEPSTLWFNRIGFPVLLLLAIRYTVVGLRERRAESERQGLGDGASAGE
jgi:hypothetical protein